MRILASWINPSESVYCLIVNFFKKELSSVLNHTPISFHRAVKAYMRILFFLAMIVALMAFCFYLFQEVYSRNAPISKPFLIELITLTILSSIIPFLIMGFLIKSLSAFLNVTHPVSMTNDGIKIGTHDYPFSEIKQIKTIDLDLINLECFFGASVLFTNGETKFIIGEKFYKEDALLFQELENIQKEHFPLRGENHNRIMSVGVASTDKESFDFNIFSSLLFLLFLAFSSISIWNIVENHPSIGLTCFFIALSVSLYALAIRETYYFIVNDAGLEIKNKLYFGYSKTYRFDNIKGVAIYEKGSGRSVKNGMIIITNDYHSIFFASNPLRFKKRVTLGETLRNAGVVVVSQWEKIK